MHVVVNRLTFKQQPPQSALTALEGEIGDRARAIPGFRGAHFARVDDTNYLMIVFGETPAALERISAEAGGPWVGEHLAPSFGAPPQRSVATIVASTEWPAAAT